MGQQENSTKKQGKPALQEKERYQIEILAKEGKKAQDIATLLGRDRRTIERELVRGTVEQVDSEWRTHRVYCADVGQRVAEERQVNKGRPLKIGKDHALAAYLEVKIGREKYSPEAALQALKRTGKGQYTSLCFKTVYNYIDQGLFLNLSNKDLPVKKDAKKRAYRPVRRVALNNLSGRSIQDRPTHVEAREDYGHWEMDCVVGKGRACLLVLTERSCRRELIFKLREKTQAQVVRCIDHLERKHGKRFSQLFQSITMDNGSEFLDMQSLERSCLRKGKKRTTCYYAHPYCAWERGSNEVNNRLIRRFIPKGTDIAKISRREVARIEHWMNHYPRRQFGFRSAMEVEAALLHHSTWAT